MASKAVRMMGVNSLPSESYRCLSCETDFEREAVYRTWKCPACDEEYIYVYAEDAGHGVRIVLTRKAASEIVPGDVVHLDGQLTKEPYMVLGINQRKGLLGIALKGYGEVQIHPDAPINCREGAW